MDLANIDIAAKSEEGGKLLLKNPATGEILVNDKKEPYYVIVVGRYSDTFQKTSRAVMNRRMKQNVGRRSVKVSAEQIDQEDTETMSRCVKEWNLMIEKKIPPVDFDSVYRILSDPRFRWIKDQISEFVDDDANFSTT